MNELNDRAESFLRSSEGKKLMGKKEELSSLASSEDGKTVKEMLEKIELVGGGQKHLLMNTCVPST